MSGGRRAGATRVLVVDDRSPTREGLCALIATVPGAEVVGTAANGAEAVRLVGRLRPDVVLMDVQMPIMSGLEATRRIKARYPSVKVIALSVCSAYRNEARVAGADLFLVKGSPSERLVEAVIAFGAAPAPVRPLRAARWHQAAPWACPGHPALL